ncbi:MAG TPA: SPOR domain-containing protein [Thermoanaerobaculia bacterium]|nr:SPOR domain-containing protein [Thermoanaerobaculia bacterium]
MEELHAAADDQSHYEISLTAGQAFVAFVLLLLSLAAAFAFGLMIGKGQADERLVVRKETPVVTEAGLVPKKSEGKIVELGVSNDDFEDTTTAAAEPAPQTETSVAPAASAGGEVTTTDAPVTTTAEAAVVPPAPAPAATAPVLHVTTYAQLLSTGDQKTAEALAARLIDRGFTAAYVERGATDKGAVYRVRVKFDSEAEARAAEAKLKEFSKEVWITTK